MRPQPLKRFLYLTLWISFAFAIIGYLSAVLTTPHLSALAFCLLTLIYSAWTLALLIGRLRFQFELQTFSSRPYHYWLLTLFCLACISQFLPLPYTNPYWLPILPIITATLMMSVKPRIFGLLAAVALWLCSHIAFSIIIPDWDISSQATLLLSFVTPCGFAAMVHELVFARSTLERSNSELVAAHTRLQEYSDQVEELSATRERNRIAREIHDTLGHALTLLAVQLETATQLETRHDPRLHEELLQARQVAKACLTEVRHSVEALRPDEASTGTLQEQLQKLATEFEIACQHETRITLDLDEVTQLMNPELRLTLYRCAQEALTNIRKHAHATKVLLRLATSDDREDAIELTILDNGRGALAAQEQATTGFGLLGMRERIELLNGSLRVGPESESGWRVEVIVPLTQHLHLEMPIISTSNAGKQV